MTITRRSVIALPFAAMAGGFDSGDSVTLKRELPEVRLLTVEFRGRFAAACGNMQVGSPIYFDEELLGHVRHIEWREDGSILAHVAERRSLTFTLDLDTPHA